MKIIHDGKKYLVKWDHIHGNEINLVSSGLSEIAQAATVCTIYECSDQDPKKFKELVRAHAACSLKDRFNKEKGRKVSMARALTPWDRSFRTVVWKAYFAR